MDSEPVELMTPNPRYARGVKDLAFRRNHTRFVKEHDKQYIERHNLAKVVDEAWERCLVQKPKEPLSFLANILDPFSQRKIVLKLQEEIEDLRAEGAKSIVLKGHVTYLKEREVQLVTETFTAILLNPSVGEEFYHCISAASVDVSSRLRAFDESCSDVSRRFLPMMRLLTNHLHDPALVEGFIRGVARLHLNFGLLERDYIPVTTAILALVKRNLTEEATKRDNATKRAWVKLHALISITMSAGGQMRDLHAKHQTSLAMTADEISLVKASLSKVHDKSSAATAIARAVIDVSPAAASILEERGMSPTAMGSKLLDGVELVIEMLERRGLRPALDYMRVLGQKHAGWGVSQGVYPGVGQALLAAVGHSLGRDSEKLITDALRAWRKALDMLVGLLKRPLAPGDPIPSADTMAISELRAQPVDPNLETDLAEIISGRATPDFTSSTPDVKQTVGDVTNVPVTEAQLQLLFNKYDTDNSRWISKDTMVKILMSQEEFGVPITKNRATRQVDDILRKAKVDKGRVNFHLFSILMLQVAQR